MNALIDRLPNAVEIDGMEYPINSDFRVALKVMQAFEDPELTWFEKQAIMLDLLYPEMPPNVEKACELAVKFLNCGEQAKTESDHKRVFSFDKDSKYIFSGMYQTHGVDLESVEYMHWWKFCYLFYDLQDDCFFNRIRYFRQQKNKGKLTKEEAAYCREIQDILELPQTDYSDAYYANDLMEYINGG